MKFRYNEPLEVNSWIDLEVSHEGKPMWVSGRVTCKQGGYVETQFNFSSLDGFEHVPMPEGAPSKLVRE
jgi:hypothetical protein